MKDFELVMKHFLHAFKANARGMHALSERYYKSILDSAYFKHRAPAYFRVQVLYNCAEIKLNLKKYEEAKTLALEAIKENKSLDKSFKEYSGSELYFYFRIPDPAPSRISGPCRVLGDIHFALNEYERAKRAYMNALAIDPSNCKALYGIHRIRLHHKAMALEKLSSDAFSKILIKYSPWQMDWKSITNNKLGTVKMDFSFTDKSAVFSGRLFENSLGISSGVLKKISIYNNYITFTFSLSKNKFDFFLVPEQKLLGVISDCQDGHFFLASAVAKPYMARGT